LAGHPSTTGKPQRQITDISDGKGAAVHQCCRVESRVGRIITLLNQRKAVRAGWGMLKILSPAEPVASVIGVDATRSQVIPSLDGIRAISVLLVVLAHAGFAVAPGGLGVTIFFFLSGYLISTLMLAESEKTGRIDILKFYARRMFRLMPPLVITLAIAYGLTYAGLLAGGTAIGGLAAELLYFANYYIVFFDRGNTIPAGTGVLWSLAVEEHFYIFYPLLMNLLLSRENAVRPRTIGLMLGVVCLAVLSWRIHLAHSPGFSIERTSFGSDARIDSIIFGCILAVMKNPMRELRRPGAMSPWHWTGLAIAAAVVVFSLVYRDSIFRETARYTLQGLALMPIFYCAVRFSSHPLFRYLNSPWAMKLGRYSYAIYLIHFMVMNVVVTNAPALGGKPFIVLPTALVISIAYAAAIDRFVDPYFRQLRRKYRSVGSEERPRSQRLQSHGLAAE
jgi:peptidoglycan/LPS O-acetylase OafA/YrhL